MAVSARGNENLIRIYMVTRRNSTLHCICFVSCRSNRSRTGFAAGRPGSVAQARSRAAVIDTETLRALTQFNKRVMHYRSGLAHWVSGTDAVPKLNIAEHRPSVLVIPPRFTRRRGRPCPSGQRGCLQRYASLNAQHERLGRSTEFHVLEQIETKSPEVLEAWLVEATAHLSPMIGMLENILIRKQSFFERAEFQSLKDEFASEPPEVKPGTPFAGHRRLSERSA